MTLNRLIGSGPNQVSVNGMLGDLAFQSADNVSLGDLFTDGDITLDDGGTFVTTLQTVTPTANRTISFPNATGTVALVAGSSGQLLYNNAGANAGVPSSVIGATGDVTLALNGAASTPPLDVTGTWFTGGTSTTTKPQVLIEPAGTTSTAWSTSGTGLGVNAASGFAGNLLDLQVNGTTTLNINSSGVVDTTDSGAYQFRADRGLYWTGALELRTNFNSVLINTTSVDRYFAIGISAGTPSVLIYPEALNVWAQRNGTNAQTSRVYNTYTSSTNYELGKLEWASNVFRIGTEKGSGGGTARDLSFHTDGTERARIDSSGRLGLGTSSPKTKLDCNLGSGELAFFGGQIGTTSGLYTGIAFGYSNNNTSLVYAKSAIVQEQIGDGTSATGKIHILNNNTAGGANAGLADARLTITPAGNVGIGTTTPGQLLEVRNPSAATQTLVGIGDANLPRLLVGYSPGSSPSSNDSSAVFTDNFGNILLSTRSNVANTILFNTSTGTGAATERARIDSAGRLLVGTTTQQGLLTLGSGSHYSSVDPGATIKKVDYVSTMGGAGFFSWRTWRSGKNYASGVSGVATIAIPNPGHLRVKILATVDGVGVRNYAYEAYVFNNGGTITVDIIKETTQISAATPVVSSSNLVFNCPAAAVNQSLIYVEVEQVSSQNDTSISFS